MYNTEDVISRIIHFAQSRNDIDFVIQNGSRVNPNYSPDEYADFDIIMGCRDWTKYCSNRNWINEFGKLLIVQQNEVRENENEWPIFLMQFSDGLRIDLQFFPGDPNEIYHSDSLSKILLDKRSLFKNTFEPSENTYICSMPDKEKYCKEVNEFWWCIINVAKGIAREELTYSHFMYDCVVRESFLMIVSWYISSKANWKVNTGKFGKFLEKYADNELWEGIKSTYKTDSYEAFWDSINNACSLIAYIDKELRLKLHITEKPEDSHSVLAFINGIKEKSKMRPTTAST